MTNSDEVEHVFRCSACSRQHKAIIKFSGSWGFPLREQGLKYTCPVNDKGQILEIDLNSDKYRKYRSKKAQIKEVIDLGDTK
jgi:hypothetical protein